MGYAVYEDPFTRDRGVERWAGYAVPAECDTADCHEKIDRGMGYRCETYWHYEMDADGEEIEEEREGCNLHFCPKHENHNAHGDDVVPKPDTLEWRRWQLHHESWAEWREHNPDTVAQIIAELNGGDATQERTLLLGVTEKDGFPVLGNSMILDDRDKPNLEQWIAKGWTVAETHMPPFSDPRTDDIVQLVRDQWVELHEVEEVPTDAQ